jgi:SAM-dependent methyltransferase
MSIKHEFRKILWKMGYDISRHGPASSPLVRRRKLLDFYAINTVLDVGANTGQFAKQLRNFGFFGKIVSFEPLSSAFELLRQNADSDPKWEVINCALGETNVTKEINVAAFVQQLSAKYATGPHQSSTRKTLCCKRTD